MLRPPCGVWPKKLTLQLYSAAAESPPLTSAVLAQLGIDGHVIASLTQHVHTMSDYKHIFVLVQPNSKDYST